MQAIDVSTPKHPNTFVTVDDEDVAMLMGFKWAVTKSDKTLYAYSRIKGSAITMHHFLLPAPKGMMTDHINGNTLDNRRENLRICTPQQSAYNRGKYGAGPKGKKFSSRFKGVSFRKKNKKYLAKIRANKREIYIGHYETEEEAARAYNLAAIQYHGEFARLNPVVG